VTIRRDTKYFEYFILFRLFKDRKKLPNFVSAETLMVLAASIIRAMITFMMEVASTSETSVNFYHTTRRNNPEDSHLHTRRRENLKCHL
jgi:hypothetical protein